MLTIDFNNLVLPDIIMNLNDILYNYSIVAHLDKYYVVSLALPVWQSQVSNEDLFRTWITDFDIEVGPKW